MTKSFAAITSLILVVVVIGLIAWKTSAWFSDSDSPAQKSKLYDEGVTGSVAIEPESRIAPEHADPTLADASLRAESDRSVNGFDDEMESLAAIARQMEHLINSIIENRRLLIHTAIQDTESRQPAVQSR